MNHRWKRYGGAAALGFCGYLTIATSVIPPTACPPSQHAGQVAVEVDLNTATSSLWEVTGVSPTPISEWSMETSDAAILEYVHDAGAAEVPVFRLDKPPQSRSSFDAGLSSRATDAGLVTDTDVLDVFVQEFPGGLRIVCARVTEPCQTVHFRLVPPLAGQARQLELTAHAFTPGCTSEPPVRELTLTPWQP